MSQYVDTFVFAKRNIKILGQSLIEKDDVGIVESGLEGNTKIFFVRAGETARLNKSFFEIFNVKKTGDAFPKKICNVCHKLLNTGLFDKNQNAKNNRSVRRPSCKNCRKILEGKNIDPKLKREWLKVNPEPKNSPFLCPICDKRTIAGVTSKVVLDHSHLTGKPRAWICDSCNTGIGRFKDDIAILQRAIEFLKA